MMVLRLGNKRLYCVIKLQEVQKVVLSNLGFLAYSLVSFLMSELFLHFTWLVIPSNSFDILHYPLQISHQNRKSF